MNQPQAQQGLATLMISLILLLGMTMLTMASARTSLVETRITGNETRLIEASHAADAGLEYAIAWLATHPWSSSDSPPSPPSVTAGSGDTYAISLSFSASGDLITIHSRATATSDTSISAGVSQQLRQAFLLNPTAKVTPLIVNGCIDSVTGTPDIYPSNWSSIEPVGTAIATSKVDEPAGSCIASGHFDTHDGSIVDEAFPNTAWDYLFDISKDEFQALATAEANAVASGELPSSGRSYYWITDSSNWDTSLGSASHPVFLAFAASAGCPRINGNPTIYGIVYVDGGCPDGAQGWGGAEVYGGVVMEGDLAKYNANAALYDWSEAGGSDEELPNPPIGASRLPGSWKDW